MRSDVISTDPFVRQVLAPALRVGRQLLTDDGWQTIKGLVVFEDANQVTVFTDEKDDLWTDGWPHKLDDQVLTRLQPTAEQEYQQRRRERMERRRLRRLAKAAASCPGWCIEHYDAGKPVQRNHAGEPHSVDAANAWTGDHVEVGFWLERRDDRDTGETETVGILECKTLDDVELTPANMRLLARKLMSLADRAEMTR
ncbi:MAG TPA: hypothetical protein VF657_16170 [Actinoplanes sp.]